MSLATLTLAETLKKLSQKEVSLSELYTDLDSATQNSNSELNIYLARNNEAQAQALQREHTPLQGVPIAVKDNVCTKNLVTTASATVLETFTPPYDATLIQKLETAGGVVYGKTNLDAWAHGSSTETSQFGRTLNPRNSDYLPGGSSGGSAAAVAGNVCISAIGTETAGSIRQPSAWCGAVGLKPTYGRVSRSGVIAMGSSLDCPGTIGKTVEDAAILLTTIAGHDPLDATSSPRSTPDFTKNIGTSLKGLRVGILYENLEGLAEHTQKILDSAKVLEALGCTLGSAEALDPHYAIAVYTVVQRAEVSSNLARYDGLRFGNDRSFFGDEAKRRIMLGTYTLSKGYSDRYYTTAQKVRTLFREDFAQLFTQFDVLISLTSPGYAKKVGATEGASMFGELEDMLLEPSSLTGLPGISVPCYHDPQTNLYLGMNIMAPHWKEDRIIQVADAYERATNWNSWRNNQ